jgi:pyruvate formate lyase activating enzyme
LNVCPNNAITLGNSVIQGAEQKQITLVRIDRSLCNNCGACSEKCYPQALFICGTDYTVNDIVARVLKDRLFYENSGGGVTVSGGEPLAQPEFTLEVFKRLKEAGINTALDTTGYVAWNNIDAIIPYTDLFLYDIKHMASADHKALTGVPNQIILENAKKIAVAGGKLQIRIPLIPHFNDSDQNLTATANFCKDLGDAIDSVQLLPYHNMGTMKYLRLAEDTKVMEATPHTDVQIANIRAIMEGYGFHVTVH